MPQPSGKRALTSRRLLARQPASSSHLSFLGFLRLVGTGMPEPQAEVVVYTQYEDVAYSPCGIPYVHGGEIPDFERLFLAGKQAYVDAGIDVHYETEVTSIDPAAKTVTVASEGSA